MNHETAVSNAKDIADRILAPAARTARAREQGRGRRSRHRCYLGGMRVCGGAAFSKHLAIERLFRDAHAGTVMAPTGNVLRDFIGKPFWEYRCSRDDARAN